MARPGWAKSVRFQLTFWYVTTLAVILLLAATVLFVGLREAMLHATDRTLATEAAEIAHLLTTPLEADAGERAERPDPAAVLGQAASGMAPLRGLSADPLFLRLSLLSSGRTVAVSRSLDPPGPLAATLAVLPPSPAARPTFCFAGPDEETRVRCLTVRVPQTPYCLQVALPWDGVEDLLMRLMVGTGAAIALFLGLSGVGSWLLVGRAFRPIEDIVTEAERLTAERPASMTLRPRALSDNEIGRLVAALNRMLARLSEAFAAQRQFTADASHELRTPLTILQGEMEMALARERPAVEYRRTLRSGLEETRRMARIVEGLSLLARGDADRERPPARTGTRVSLATLARDAALALAPAAAEKGLTVIVNGEEADAEGDAEALSRVVRNLIDNAIRYTPSGGRITVTAQNGPAGPSLSVTDTGIGIAPTDLPGVFDRFTRADKARANNGGSGLGLAICRSIVAAHGGQMEAQSMLGVGSRFAFTLPAIKEI